MATYQYRLYTDADWNSQYGFGIVIINNKSDSGKKLILKSLSCDVSSINTPTTIAATTTAQLHFCTASIDGENMSSSCIPLNSGSLSNVYISRYADFGGDNEIIRKYTINRHGSTAGTQNTLSTLRNFGSRKRMFGNYTSVSGSLVEPYTIGSGRALSLVPDFIGQNSPMYVDLTFKVNSSIFKSTFFANSYIGRSLFTINNTSNDTVSLIDFSVREAGTTDTPYIRLVPVGQLGVEFLNFNYNKRIQVMPMDSTYPSASQWINIYSDLYFIPYNVPESYLTETTAGTPKGFNYLHTKDFNGPTLRTFFPEFEHIKPNARCSALGYSYGFNKLDLNVIKSEITINEGESLAIIGSSETAAAGQPSWSGWPTLTFAAQISVENAYTPYLTLTGLQDNSEVRIFDAGTTTELSGAENVTGGSFSWQYDYTLYSSIDIVVHSLGYNYYRLESVAITSAGLTIPIDQQLDRVYLNP